MKPHLPLCLRRLLTRSLTQQFIHTICSAGMLASGCILSMGTAQAELVGDSPGLRSEARQAISGEREEEKVSRWSWDLSFLWSWWEDNQEIEKKEKEAPLSFTEEGTFSTEPVAVEDLPGKTSLGEFTWMPTRRIVLIMPFMPFERTSGGDVYYMPPPTRPLATSYRPTTSPATNEKKKTTTQEEDEEETLTATTTEEGGSSFGDNSTRGFDSMPIMRAMRSVRSVAMAAAAEPIYYWTGNANDLWDTSSRNWTLSGSTTSFVSGSPVAFTSSGQKTDINVTSARTVSDMTITGAGYTFSGGGDITVTGTLDIMASGDTTFASGTDVDAATVKLRSEHGTTTTFAGALEANTLTLSNSTSVTDAGHFAGNYVFDGRVEVSGAFSADLGTADTGANLDEALTVNGSLSASSLYLSGAAMKFFGGNVTTTGDVNINASNDEAGRNGATTFLGELNVGGSFTLNNNATVVIESDGDLSISGNFYMGDATLNYTRYTNTEVHNFGTIRLISDGAQLGLDSLSRGKATIRSNGDTPYNFTFINNSREFAATLDNLSDLNVQGGTITVTEASSGQLSGSITVSGNSTLILKASDIFTAEATGNINVSTATLNLGSCSQNFNGDISLNQGRINGSDGGSLITTRDTTLTYTNAGNFLSATVDAGSHALTMQAATTGGSAAELSIDGDITGTGTLSFAGEGTTHVESELSYTGSVTIGKGTTLVLDDSHSLASASSLSVGDGATLSVTHDGSTTYLNGSGALLLQSGAEINFSDLSGHDNTPALALTGELLFGGDIKFTFHENRTDENGERVKLVNLHTYELITSATGINRVAGTSAGSDVVYANGKDTPLDSSQYEFGFYSEKFYNASGELTQEIRHLTFTMLAGKNWIGGESGEWHEKTDDDYTNWSEGVVGSAALFREQVTTADDDNLLTDADGNAVLTDSGKNVMKDVAITMKTSSGATDLYMDGRTNYTITGVEELKDAANRVFNNDASIIKKGSGTMTWSGVALNLAGADIQEGTLLVADNSTLTASGAINVADVAYNSAGERVTSANLAIGAGSVFQQGSGTVAASSREMNATLHGVSISDGTISGSGYSTHTIANAKVDGFTVDNTTFTGSGSLSNLTVHEGVTIGSGAKYELGDNMDVLSQITNEGTIKVTSSSLIGVGRLGEEYYSVSNNGTTTYTPFSGSGTYEGWENLTEANFRVRGTNLDKIKDIEVTTNTPGKVTVTCDDVRFIRWDSIFNEDASLTPTVGVYYNNGRTNLTVASSTSTNYRYDQRLQNMTPEELAMHKNDYVVYLGTNAGKESTSSGSWPWSGSTTNYYTLTGASANSEDSPANIWIHDDGSRYKTYIAGASSGTSSSNFYGDTHLQIKGYLANADEITGASKGASQHGDSYLTIEGGGDYSDTSIVAGSRNAVHYGNSSLHLLDGTYGTVYGGTYNSYTSGGYTHVIVEGGTIANLYGGDYSTSRTTHTGDVIIDLMGGTFTNIYAAGGSSNANKVEGDVTVNFHADASGNMLATFSKKVQSGTFYEEGNPYPSYKYSLISGGNTSLSDRSLYTSTLAFVDAGSYNLTDVEINNFDTLSLVQGASVTASVNILNNDNEITISGPGHLTLVGEDKARHKTNNIRLTNGATLLPQVYSYSYYKNDQVYAPRIYVEAGSTVDVTGFPIEASTDLAMRLDLAGDGTEGQGALYKTATGIDDARNNKVCLGYITLTDNASVGVDGETTGIFMIATKVIDFDTIVDLTNDSTSTRGYTFTKQGSGTFGFKNTTVQGGTINVVNGTLETSHSSRAADTDLVLHSGATLSFTSDVGTPLQDAIDNTHNGFVVETLSGAGTVNLNEKGWLYLSMNQGYTDFSDDFATTAKEGQTFYNDENYRYAHFTGKITGTGLVSKTGSGTQYFYGSESDYAGRTYVLGGTLYLMGTSTAKDFAQATLGDDEKLSASTTVTEGVLGVGDIHWQGGDVFLGDGVTIYNNSTDATLNTGSINIGVDAVEQEDGSYYYNDATWSGVMISETGMHKLGLGTLNVDQRGSFAGGTEIHGGTLNLTGWASANDATIAMASGATLMFSYDCSYEGEGSTEIIGADTELHLTGAGDARWLTDNKTGSEEETAALISNIGAGKTLTIAGVISDGTSVSGNLLHSGEGTLVLSGTNTYTGGSTISHGIVTVANDTGLGATATAPTANLVTYKDSTLIISDGVSSTLAAWAHEEGTASYTGNNIRGRVVIGSDATDAAASRLLMTGDGYYATRTELNDNATLVFNGVNSSNWSTGEDAKPGAGTLAGGGKVAVSDAEGKGTSVYFSVTDTLKAGQNGFAGDLVVEGDNALLYLQAGQLSGGSFHVSGNGARIDAQRSAVTVGTGQKIELRSMGDANKQPGSTATLAASTVVVTAGGHLLASREKTTYLYNDAQLAEATQLPMTHALGSYKSSEPTDYHQDAACDELNIKYDKYYMSSAAYSSNRQTAAALETISGLTMQAGSIYEIYDTNVSLANTQLTFDVTDESKIILRGDQYFKEFIKLLEEMKDYTAEQEAAAQTRQWVLFSDVGSFNAIKNGTNHSSDATALQYSELRNQIYVMMARDFLVADYQTTEAGIQTLADDGYTTFGDNILLVYDAGARVVYLDRSPNNYNYDEPVEYQNLPIPEPGTATLSLLALTALMARRRRR